MTTSPADGKARGITDQDLIRLIKYIIENISRVVEAEGGKTEQRNVFIKEHIQKIYEQANLKLPQDVQELVFKEVLNELAGFGPLQPLLDDPDVSEVMVNGSKSVYVEKKRAVNQDKYCI